MVELKVSILLRCMTFDAKVRKCAIKLEDTAFLVKLEFGGITCTIIEQNYKRSSVSIATSLVSGCIG